MGGISKIRGLRKTDAVAPGADFSSMERLELIGILLVVERDGADVEVTGLSLRFDASGLAVRRSNGDAVVELPWVALRQLLPKARDEKDGGFARVELDVQTDHKTHRFIVPNVTLDVLKTSLETLATRYARIELVGEPDKKVKSFRLR